MLLLSLFPLPLSFFLLLLLLILPLHLLLQHGCRCCFPRQHLLLLAPAAAAGTACSPLHLAGQELIWPIGSVASRQRRGYFVLSFVAAIRLKREGKRGSDRPVLRQRRGARNERGVRPSWSSAFLRGVPVNTEREEKLTEEELGFSNSPTSRRARASLRWFHGFYLTTWAHK